MKKSNVYCSNCLVEALKAKLNGEAQKTSEAPKDNYAVTMHKKRRAKISTNSNYAKAWRG